VGVGSQIDTFDAQADKPRYKVHSEVKAVEARIVLIDDWVLQQ
jgi:hypothetical protein